MDKNNNREKKSQKLDTQRVRLSGYGVELHLKSTEYKSQDDSPRSDDLQNAQNDAEIENEVEGFDFKKLKYVELARQSPPPPEKSVFKISISFASEQRTLSKFGTFIGPSTKLFA